MASPEGKKGSSSGGRRRGSQTLRTPSIRREADAPVTLRGWLLKQGRDGLMLWKKRWFVLSQYCLFYYHGPEEEKVLGSILLPSYTISPCSSEERVYRKYAFKAEHRNTRTYYFAAETKESMIQWMNALSLATILHENVGSEFEKTPVRASSSSTLNRSTAGTNGYDNRNQHPSGRNHSKKPSNLPLTLSTPLNGDAYKLNASFDSTLSGRLEADDPAGQRQPLYANAPPKPRRLNTSREYSSSSPDRSPERDKDVAAELAAAAAATPSSAMYDSYSQRIGNGWGRPASTDLVSLGHSPQLGHLVMQNAERRTPDAYGRFKPDYEDVYNNSSHSSGSWKTRQLNNQREMRDYAAAFNSNHRDNSKVARRVPARPQSADFLEMSASREDQLNRNRIVEQEPTSGDYWSEENYAQQVRQSAVMRNFPRSRDSSHSNGDSTVLSGPRAVREEEISRDVKESALWSYVKQSNGQQHHPGRLKLSNSQENLIDTGADPEATAKMFSRSASARLPRLKQPDVLNTSLPDSKLKDLELKKMEQREESMKRLLEWKQRMLQSPLTRKTGQRSERNTPTPQSVESPRLPVPQPPQSSAACTRVTTSHELQQNLYINQVDPNGSRDPAGSVNGDDFSSGGGNRCDPLRAANAEQLFRPELMAESNDWSPNVAFRASLKRTKQLKLNEADVRKEFTYEYVSGDPGPVVLSADPVVARPKGWPPSLMREKSSAIQDLRARSESPSANKVLGEQLLKEPLQPCTLSGLSAEAQVSHLKKEAKLKPKPPPKPGELVPSLVAGPAKRLAMALDEFESPELTQAPAGQRFSLAESLPESLAGFAATIISEGSNSPIEPAVSPLTSECDWHNTNASPAPLPDLMSLASAVSPAATYEDPMPESLYMNTLQDSLAGVAEDHYLPMTSAKLSILSPQPASSSFALNRTEFEENAYVEMQDDGRKLATGRPLGDGKASGSVFAGVLDPSYRHDRNAASAGGAAGSPESPRYSEISDCAIHSTAEADQPHYEFIYKASTQGEPVYMEVPQGDETGAATAGMGAGHDMTSHSVAEPQEPRSVDSAPSAARPNENQSLSEANEENSRLMDLELDLIAPPRHPRFSLSDTFRPASYFLNSGAKNGKRLETIASREDIDFEGHESSDTELVSPPPIPTSPPPLEEFGSRVSNGQTDDSLARLRNFNRTHAVHSRSQSLDMNNEPTARNALTDGRLSNTVCGASGRSSSSRSSLTESMSKLNSSWQENSKRKPLAVVRSLEDLLADSDDIHPQDDGRQSLADHGGYAAESIPAFRGSTQSLTFSAKSSTILELSWHQPLYENVQYNSTPSPCIEPRHIPSTIPPESPVSISRLPPTSTPAAPGVHQRGNSTLSSLSLASSASTCSVSRSEQNGAPYYYSDLLAGKADESAEAEASGRDSSQRGRIPHPKHNYSIDRLRTVHHNPRDFGTERPSSSLRSVDRKISTASSSSDLDSSRLTAVGDSPDVHRLQSTASGRNQLERGRQMNRAQTPDLLANSSSNYQSAQGPRVNGQSSDTGASSVIRSGQVMRRVRSLEGLLDDDTEAKENGNPPGVFQTSIPQIPTGRTPQGPTHPNASTLMHSARSRSGFSGLNSASPGPGPGPGPGTAGEQHTPSVLKETPRYARDPTSRRTTPPGPANSRPETICMPSIGEFSAWDEDGLWRDKLRRASIRHTRSLDMLNDDGQNRKPRLAVAPPMEPPTSCGPDEGDCYERLLQYSATLERTKRGQTYLDGYTWDEKEQRFRKPGHEKSQSPDPRAGGASSAASNERSPIQHHFLDDSLPPTFEIDREKLRQWDLMSTAPVLTTSDGPKEGGRRSSGCRSGTQHHQPIHSKDPAQGCSTLQRRLAPDTRTKEKKINGPPAGGGAGGRPDHRLTDPPMCHDPAPASPLHPTQRIGREMSPHSPPTAPPLPDLTLSPVRSHALNALPVRPVHLATGGTSPTSEFTPTASNGAGSSVPFKNVSYHSANNNGPLDGAQSPVLITTQPKSTSSQKDDLYFSDTDQHMPPKKGKLPPMMGQSREGSGTKSSEKIQLSAGDLLGRTHEELVLLLIQLRRQSSALVKARDACLLEMESQVKLAALDISHRQECLTKTGDLKRHVKELEKQLEKLKPLINLVDNMVKLGSLYPLEKKLRQAKAQQALHRNSTAASDFYPSGSTKRMSSTASSSHQQQRSSESPMYCNVNQWRLMNNQSSSHPSAQHSQYGGSVQGWEEAQIAQLEAKHKQLSRLESFVREEGVAIQRLTQNQNVLRLAIRGIREQTNTALQNGDYAEVDHCRRQQLFLERELSQVHSLLALSSKRLEDTAVEINRIEQEISTVHQQLHRASVVGTLSRSGKSPQSTLNRSTTSSHGKEMVWLEAELDRVHQHVSQLQLKRQELSSQVGRLTSPECPPTHANDHHWQQSETVSKRKAQATWYETDLDNLKAADRHAAEASSSSYAASMYVNANAFLQEPVLSMPVNDINEADERMKRYYGIIPKDKPSEIRGTVRIVKRESEKRQRDKTKRSPYDDASGYAPADDPADEDQHYQPNGYHEDVDDAIMNDPVLSQFSHVLTLPRRHRDSKEEKESKRFSTIEYRARRSSLSQDTLTDSYHDAKAPINRRRNVSSLSLGDRSCSSTTLPADTGAAGDSVGDESLDSTQPSPVLTPVYTSDAAREIVEEMRRQDAVAARRAVPRLKRRHITVSCSQPLVLEALPRVDMRGLKGRAKDDADMERALRFHHPFAPDVVRSTIGQPLRINDKTIDRIFCAPDKIVIPERYVPEQQVEEVGEEEKQRRLKKAESIRRMLTGSAAVDLPRPPSVAVPNETLEPSEARQLLANERKQRDHFLGLNHFLVEELKEKSKMVAVHALAKMKSRRERGSDDDDWSPPPDPLPIYQQRYNYLT